MEKKKEEIIYKILLVGNNDSGKTSFIFRLIDNAYDPKILKTIGLDYRIKKVKLNDGVIALIQLWDTSSFDHEKIIARSYLKGANGFIVMYNITIRYSFENAAD